MSAFLYTGARPGESRAAPPPALLPVGTLVRIKADIVPSSPSLTESYRHLVDHFPDAVLLHALDGTILLCNQHAAALLGHPAEHLAGRPVFDLLAPDDHAHARQTLRATLATGSVRNIEHRLIKADGTGLSVEISAAVLRTVEGAPEALLAVVRDITDRARIERRFRVAVEAAPNGMLAVDRTGRITLVNSQAERLFGYAPNELLGQPIERLVPERFHARHSDFRREFLADPRSRPMGSGRDLFGRKKTGEEVPLEIGLNPLPIDDEGLVLVSVIDITERKQLEQLRAEFLATVTHDIRGPVGNIGGLVEFLQEMNGLPPEAADILAQMTSTVRSLFALVTNYLDSAKIEAGQLPLRCEPIDLNAVVSGVSEQYRADAQRRGVTMETDCGGELCVAGDRLALERITTNLLRNALTFTPDGGRVTLRTWRAGSAVGLVVVDTGPGIDPDAIPSLFRRYGQTAHGRNKAGTGLGLFIVKSLAEAQGGTVQVDSTPGAGTRFTVFLPAGPG